MTILFIGNEVEDFPLSGGASSVSNTTTGTLINTTNVRAGVAINGASDSSTNYSRYVGKAITVPGSMLWVHFNFALGLANALWTKSLVGLFESSTAKVEIRINTSLQMALYVNNALVKTFSTITVGTTRKVFDIRIAFGVSGSVSVWENSVLQDAYEGALDYSPDEIRFAAGVASSNSIARPNVFSEIILATVSTVGAKVLTRPANAAGNYTAWAGAYTDIDEITADDAVMTSDTAGQRASFQFSDFPTETGDEYIAAVGVSMLALRGPSGPTKINSFFRTGASDYDQSAHDLGLPEASYQTIIDQNPDSATAWTAAALNAGEIGVRSQA